MFSSRKSHNFADGLNNSSSDDDDDDDDAYFSMRQLSEQLPGAGPQTQTRGSSRSPVAPGQRQPPPPRARPPRPIAQVDPDAPYRRLAASLSCKESELRSSATIEDHTAERTSYAQIVSYVDNSQCHPACRIKVNRIYKVLRTGEARFSGSRGSPLRMMLWHGTETNTVPGILKNGFQRPVPKGQMWGNGIYFADRSSKSAQYCKVAGGKGATGFMLICDVQLGNKMYKAKNAHNEYTQPPAGFTSVKGTGSQIPSWRENVDYYGSIMPIGKTVANTRFPSYTLVHNEYVVYDPKIINLVFLVEVQFA